MKKNCILLVLLTLVNGQCLATQYAVQLEASKVPQPQRYQALSIHGNIYTEAAGNGYIRTRIGPYESKNMALDVLNEVHAAGYTNAIIARQQNSATDFSSALSNTSKQHHDMVNFDVKTLKEWKMLTPEQQSNLVYLDGVLHVKNGNQFIPLNEIIDLK